MVLRIVAGEGPVAMPLPDVHEAAGLTRPTLHRVIRSLSEGGLLHLRPEAMGERASTRLGRPRLLVSLTDEGRAALVAYRRELEARLRVVDEALDNWSAG